MKIISSNKNAARNYEILDKYEAGLKLFGTEVKSISRSNCSINEAYVIFRHNEAFIINMYVAPYLEGNINNKDSNRNRKLLLKKNEIIKLEFLAKKDKLTIIPLRLYWRNNKIKVEIAICKGKKLHDKRQDLKNKEMQKNIRNY